MSDEYAKTLANHQRDLAAGRHGNRSAGNPYTISYQQGAALGGRDPNTGQRLNTTHVQGAPAPTPSVGGSASTPAAALGGLLFVLAVIGYFGVQAYGNMQRAAETQARVAPAVAPTHYVVMSDAPYFYAEGTRRDERARSDIVEPRAGKCFDLTRLPQRAGRVTVDLPTTHGRVFRMYTAEATFAPLPAGARCEHQYHRP